MKKHLIPLFIILSLHMHAQQNTVVAGGDAKTMDGTVSYTLGQSTYTSNSESSGTINEGIQQPYQVFEILSTDEFIEHFNVSVYPNPASKEITLEVENYKNENLTYRLFDINGKLLLTDNLIGNKTRIPLNKLSSANYLLKISNGNKEVTTFKILKNN